MPYLRPVAGPEGGGGIAEAVGEGLRAGDRTTEFRQRVLGLGIEGVTPHSYRYAWAERALKCGYPERFAQPPCEGMIFTVRSAATHRVLPLQLREVDPSMYHRASYSMLGLESEAKLQTRMICLFVCCFSVPVP